MRDVTGKTAFITGGASGIGLALGRAFLEAGMKVMLADIEAEPLQRAVEGLRALGDVQGVVCDVTDGASVDRAAAATIAAFGKIDVLCNNAGVAGGSGIEHISAETWRWVIDVNLMGVVHGVRSVLPLIRAHGDGGHIVNTASVAGFASGMGFSPYAASKSAVVNMSEGLALQRSRGRRATGAGGDPRRPPLYIHPPGDEARNGPAICRDPNGHGQGGNRPLTRCNAVTPLAFTPRTPFGQRGVCSNEHERDDR